MIQTFIDQLGRNVVVHFPPKKIISLVPSQTELLSHLGLEKEIIGITKFCIHPENLHKIKTQIGGTKSISLKKIEELQPDLVIANKEENDQEQIAALSLQFPVWISDIKNLEEALNMILEIGNLTDRKENSIEISSQIRTRFSAIQPQTRKRTCAYLIWWNPIMTINSATFIHDMLNRCGLENVFANRIDSRYPVISEEELIDAAPEYLLLSSEPYPFKATHASHFRKILPNTKLIMADGENYSWFGSRLLQFQTPSLK